MGSSQWQHIPLHSAKHHTCREKAEKQVQQLQAQVTELDKTLSEAQTARDAAQHELQAAQASLEERQLRLSQLEQQLAEKVTALTATEECRGVAEVRWPRCALLRCAAQHACMQGGSWC